ncbi:TRAP transporter small permease [Acuticoccus kandeliae]|uniref:TRAP transporter small permease n=1 Tax=Acuticoccus kandeliae TaxID=2073160 RepID=UPI000D3E63A0|nr:TRAP transporter small permease [Acuticoccus kandeliae]
MRLACRAAAEGLVALAAIGLLAIMGVTVADVVSRHLFNAPIQGVVDMVELAMAWATFLGIAATFFLGGHIVVDLVDTVAGPGTMRLVRILAGVATVALMGGLTWLAVREFGEVAEWGDTTVDLGIPLTIYWAPVLAGYGLGALFALMRLLLGEAE